MPSMAKSLRKMSYSWGSISSWGSIGDWSSNSGNWGGIGDWGSDSGNWGSVGEWLGSIGKWGGISLVCDSGVELSDGGEGRVDSLGVGGGRVSGSSDGLLRLSSDGWVSQVGDSASVGVGSEGDNDESLYEKEKQIID